MNNDIIIPGKPKTIEDQLTDIFNIMGYGGRDLPDHERALEAFKRRARGDFGEYMRLMFPGYVEGDHLDRLRTVLTGVESGEIQRLIVTLGPRHSKSMHVSEGFPAWYLGRHPDKRIITASHTQRLAETFSRRVRNAIASNLWPFPWVSIAPDRAGVQQWDLNGTGGGYMAVGVGGSPTGQGADCVIGNTHICTDHGIISIEDLHRRHDGVRVASFNHESGEFEYMPIVASREVTSDDIWEIRTGNGRRLRATGDHRVFVEGRGYRPVRELAGGDRLVSVRGVREGVREEAIRGEEGRAAGEECSVLLADLCEQRDQSRKEVEVLSGMRWPRPEISGEVLLGFMPGRREGEGEVFPDEGLSGVRVEVLASGQDIGVLQRGLQERSSFGADGRRGESEVSPWSGAGRIVSRNEGGCSGSGSHEVCGLPVGLSASLPSYQHGSHGQPSGEPHYPLPPVPSEGSCRVEPDTVVSVERIGGEPVPVYDIQVAGNRNFFAGEILVHNCIIVDDPVRSQEDADSEVIREKTWEWYRGTLYTRRQPGAAIIVTACMVGDTAVSMADGSEKPLRDIAIGDEVLTFDDGEMSSSVVSNWIEYPDDDIYTVTMTSGRSFRANARHPFLMYHEGVLQWTRLENLQPTNCLIAAANIGTPTEARGGRITEPMMASRAVRRGVESQSPPRGTATRTTIRRDGPLATGLPATMLSTSGRGISRTDMALSEALTTGCSTIRGACAPSAETVSIPNPTTQSDDTSTSITIIRLDVSGGFSVTDATLPLAGSSDSTGSKPPFDTSRFQIDEIASIAPSGREPVYDITVDRTENFIADGLVSHNTRWHEDDLTGRLLKQAAEGGEQWEVLDLPAENPDGSFLWTEYWSPEEYEKAKMASTRVWNAQYMGRPSTEGGNLIREDWFGEAPLGESYHHIVISYDTADKVGLGNDYTSCTVIGVTEAYYDILLITSQRFEFPDLIEEIKSRLTWASNTWRGVPISLVIEDAKSGTAAIQTMKHTTRYPVFGAKPTRTNEKEVRVIEVTPILKAGRVRFLQLCPWKPAFLTQATQFPYATNDDMVDSFTIGLRFAAGIGDNIPAESRSYLAGEPEPEPFTRRKPRTPSRRPT